MWTVRRFRSKETFDKWMSKNQHRIQWNIIFIENVPYAIEYRKLVKPRMPR